MVMIQNPQNDVAAVVLAGGQGRRIGGGKPLRLLGNERLVDRALATARRLSTYVALSVGSDGRLEDCDVPQIADPERDWGALGGLAAGLDFALLQGLDLVVTLPCDSPFLPDDLLTRLHASLRSGQGAALPECGGRLHVACGLWRVGVRAVLIDYAQSGGRALHGLAERVGYTPVAWDPGPLDPFFNINTEQDLALAQTMLGDMQKILP
jgi:molybdopterin-guanine dinucleotide biosynthesis protein A